MPLGDAIIEWVEITDDSPLAGMTLSEANVRTETGVSVIAVQRGEETISNPAPEFEMKADDLIVAIGTRDEQAALSDLVEPND